MIRHVTLRDCAEKIGDFMEARLTHPEIVEWARAAMFAVEMPASEQQEIVDLLQDLSRSTPETLAAAAKNYRLMQSPLAPNPPPSRIRR